MTLFAPKTLKPYPFQADAIEGLRGALRQGHKRIIFCLPTGGGKTECAAFLIQEAMGKRSRVAFVADRRTLVKQTSQRFTDYGIPHGIAMAGDTTRRNEPIQICSAQTLEKREWWPELDLLVVDECQTRRKAVEDFAKEWGGPVIGLSATPLTKGLDQTYSCVVNGATTQYLQNTVNPDTGQTYLAPLRIFPAIAIDMAGAAKDKSGEWTGEAVRERSRRIIGHIVSEWVRMTDLHFGGPVKTLLFTANVAHGNELCEMFQLAGYDFRQTTYRDSEGETDRLVEGFRRGDFIGLASVEKLAKGFDVPDVLCGIDARPNSSSLAAVIQKMGRVMRYSPGKEYALWLDHAENMLGWYEDVAAVWEKGVQRLPSKETKKATRKEGEARPDVVCHGCGMVLPPGSTTCPFCGKPRPRRRSGVRTVDGRIGDEMTRNNSEEWMAGRRWVWRQMCRVAISFPFRRDEAAALKYARAQYHQLYDSWSPWEFDPVEDRADSRVAQKMKQQYQQYKRRERAE